MQRLAGGDAAFLFIEGPTQTSVCVDLAELSPATDDAPALTLASLREHVWPLLDAGRIGPVMDSEVPLEKASEAHARMESSAHVGKIVLKVA